MDAEDESKLLDELLATLSYELRAPLNAVLGWAEMLRARAGIDSELRQGLEAIARNARAQAQLIEDLLEVNRILSGNIRLELQRTDLVSIVEAAVDTIRPSAEAGSIYIRKVLDPQAAPMVGDPHRLQQVVCNLLSNAVKFTPRGGTVDVRLHRLDGEVEIAVTDSGLGIRPEVLPHIFERFRLADRSSTRGHGSLGFGLSIVKQLVELHGGSVRAHSGGDGAGARFVVNLPLRAIGNGASRGRPKAEPTAVIRHEVELSGVKVLVIDDEPDGRELVRWVLIDAHAEVITASSADEALAVLKSARPDVLVSDIGMPERDGYQLMKEVRSLDPEDGGRTPAIALTAFARSEDRTRALLAGFQVHIAKPIEPHELVVTIGSLTGRTGTHER